MKAKVTMRKSTTPQAPDAGAALDVALREVHAILRMRDWTRATIYVLADGRVELHCHEGPGGLFHRIAYRADLDQPESVDPLPSVRLAQLRDDAEAARARGFR